MVGRLPHCARGFSAVVTSANPLLQGNGPLKNYWRHAGRENIDGAIRDVMGDVSLYQEERLPLDVSAAMSGPASGSLKSDLGISHVIHVIAPDCLYGPERPTPIEQLETVYLNAMKEAVSLGPGTEKVAFGAIGAGVRGFRQAQSALCAKRALDSLLQNQSRGRQVQWTFFVLDEQTLKTWKAVWSK